MINLAAHIHAKKINKRNRFNRILEGLREPKTCQQLEDDLGASRNYFTHSVTMLADAGYVKLIKPRSKFQASNVWQAINFDYREDGIDYDQEPKLFMQQQSPNEPYVGLAAPVYRHNPNHKHFIPKYTEQSQQARREWKSDKVYAGTYGEINV